MSDDKAGNIIWCIQAAERTGLGNTLTCELAYIEVKRLESLAGLVDGLVEALEWGMSQDRIDKRDDGTESDRIELWIKHNKTLANAKRVGEESR